MINESINELAQSPYLAITGRVKHFIENPDGGTMPVSCTVYDLDTEGMSEKYKGDYVYDLGDAFEFTALALKYGAGVKIQLGNYRLCSEELTSRPEWLWYAHPGHPDWYVLEDKPLPKQFSKTKASTELVEHLKNSPRGDGVNFNGKAYYLIEVDDSLSATEGTSIATSWRDFMWCLITDIIPVIDLSKLRPYGHINDKGMKATGIFGDASDLDRKVLDSGSFLAIYWRIFNHFKHPSLATLLQVFGQINKTIHRGGVLKSGIVCTGMTYTSPLIEKYLKLPLAGLSGNQKKAVRIDENILKPEYAPLRELIEQKVNEESVFLEKIQELDSEGNELFSNVCMEILQRHRGTCLLSHINAGAIDKPEELIEAIPLVSKFVYALHTSWRKQVSYRMRDLFISQEEDNQIGVGFVGFANMLAHMGVTYKQHLNSLRAIVGIVKNLVRKEDILDPREYPLLSTADKISYSLYWGYYRAAKMFKDTGIERVFTMAPTQSVAYKYKDLAGNTLSRSIDPPTSKRVRRSSERVKTEWVFHGQNIETTKDLTPKEHQEHWELWQTLMTVAAENALGYSLSHTMSFDLWNYINENWLVDFLLNSSLQTTYYNFASTIDQSYLNKGVIQDIDLNAPQEPREMYCSLEKGFCEVCAE